VIEEYLERFLAVNFRHGVNSIPEFELMVNSGIGIYYLKNGIEIDQF